MAKPISAAGADVAGRIALIGSSIQRGRKDSVRAALMAAKRVHEGTIRSDTGGDMRISGVNRAKGRAGNAKVGVRFDLHRDGSSGLIRATGPLHIVNNNMSGHVIRSAYSRGRRRRGFIGPTLPGQFGGDRRAVLNIPGIGFRRSARHPGTKGKQTWQSGARKSRGPIRTQMRTTTFKTIAKAFTAT